MSIIVTIVRWLMILAGLLMIIVGFVTIVSSKQSDKKVPGWSILLIIWGIIQIAYMIFRMVANSYNYNG